MSRRVWTVAAAAAEGAAIAVDALRANKVRAALTVLGIVTGVATVMVMAGIVVGVRTAVLDGIEVIGAESFVVERFDFTGQGLAELGGRPWERTPPVTVQEARLVAALPAIATVSPVVTATVPAQADTMMVRELDVEGLNAGWPDYRRGTFVDGRDFLVSEVDHARSVAILSDRLARTLFGRAEAVGATVRLAGRPFEVVGVFRPQANMFTDTEYGWAVVPYSTALRYLDTDADWMQVQVVPRAGASQAVAMDQVTEALRAARGLRAAEPNNFALTKQDAFQELFDRTTRVFVVVLLLLSSVGLAVGGIGVVAIMSIAVTERTREIGIRRALGATRRDIVWQFLVESATMTMIGGGIGMAVAALAVFLLARLSPLPAAIPAWSAVAGVGVIAAAGLAFGLYPARRAAGLDPVEALRHE